MKLELELWCRLLNVYIMFEINIWKHVEKSLENWKNPKRAKIIAKIPKIRFWKKNPGTYVENYTEGYLHTKFEICILISESIIAKNEFDLLLAVN